MMQIPAMRPPALRRPAGSLPLGIGVVTSPPSHGTESPLPINSAVPSHTSRCPGLGAVAGGGQIELRLTSRAWRTARPFAIGLLPLACSHLPPNSRLGHGSLRLPIHDVPPSEVAFIPSTDVVYDTSYFACRHVWGTADEHVNAPCNEYDDRSETSSMSCCSSPHSDYEEDGDECGSMEEFGAPLSVKYSFSNFSFKDSIEDSNFDSGANRDQVEAVLQVRMS